MPKTPQQLVTPPVVYRVPGMDAITAQASNLKYGSAHDLLLMDVYRPPDRSTAPLVLLIHGPAPVETKPKDWGVFQSWGRLPRPGMPTRIGSAWRHGRAADHCLPLRSPRAFAA